MFREKPAKQAPISRPQPRRRAKRMEERATNIMRTTILEQAIKFNKKGVAHAHGAFIVVGVNRFVVLIIRRARAFSIIGL